ncbi:MAG: DUF3575 domain-containing protein [Bacteroidota bacterium]
MMLNSIRNLFLFLCLSLITLSSLGQDKDSVPVYTDPLTKKERKADTFSAMYASVGILNVLHLTASSLDLGLEYQFNPTWSLELIYGFKTPNFYQHSPQDYHVLDQYHKFWVSPKFHFADRRAADEYELLSVKFPRFSYIAFDLYYGSGSSSIENSFSVLSGNRIDFTSAELDKQVLAYGLRTGYYLKLSARLEVESSLGFGMIEYDRDYSYVNGVLGPRNDLDDGINRYNDKQSGQLRAINLILKLKFNYRIY